LQPEPGGVNQLLKLYGRFLSRIAQYLDCWQGACAERRKKLERSAKNLAFLANKVREFARIWNIQQSGCVQGLDNGFSNSAWEAVPRLFTTFFASTP
jgi:hypothetical protein